MYDLIIIGSGVSGLAAAMYAGRFKLKTLVIGEKRGGTIVMSDEVSNYPGFSKLTGLELAEKIENHAKEYGIGIKDLKVTKIAKKGKGFIVNTEKEAFETKTIIFATGTEWRRLNVKGEKEFENRGVHFCSLCDGPLYKGKVVGVVGGSDSAAKEALLLTQWAKKVYIIYRREKIRAEPIYYKKIIENKKIEILKNTNVTEIYGEKMVRGVKLDSKKDLKIDGLFVEIGRVPNSKLAKDLGVKVNEKDEIIIDKESKTNIGGFFAAGDVTNRGFKQVIIGVAEGVIAANSAYELLKR